jgi:bloom syndrome protein
MALTATATPRVSADIVRQLGMAREVVFTSSFNRPNLSYHVLKKDKAVVDAMAERLVAKQYDEFNALQPGIVYCLSRADCEKVAAELDVRSTGVVVDFAAYHIAQRPTSPCVPSDRPCLQKLLACRWARQSPVSPY